MPDTAAVNVVDVDFEHEADRRRVQSLDDQTLVYCMLGLLGEAEATPGWGKTPGARRMTRIVFGEICDRWIPPEVYGAAVEQLLGSDD